MKIKLLAFVLALTTVSWAQSANPTPNDKPAAPAANTSSCACCDKMAKDTKDMAACCRHDAKDSKSDMPCCNGEEGKACMKVSTNAAPGSCCGKDAACCKEGASCCTAKEKAQSAAKGCCAAGKCDRHAHQHASGV